MLGLTWIVVCVVCLAVGYLYANYQNQKYLAENQALNRFREDVLQREEVEREAVISLSKEVSANVREFTSQQKAQQQGINLGIQQFQDYLQSIDESITPKQLREAFDKALQTINKLSCDLQSTHQELSVLTQQLHSTDAQLSQREASLNSLLIELSATKDQLNQVTKLTMTQLKLITQQLSQDNLLSPSSTLTEEQVAALCEENKAMKVLIEDMNLTMQRFIERFQPATKTSQLNVLVSPELSSSSPRMFH